MLPMRVKKQRREAYEAARQKCYDDVEVWFGKMISVVAKMAPMGLVKGFVIWWLFQWIRIRIKPHVCSWSYQTMQ